MDNPEGSENEALAIAERGLHNALQAARTINESYPNPDSMPWAKEIQAVSQALDSGDANTLRQYAEGEIAPGFPYRRSIESYVRILNS